jgi:hypothetical protein
VALQIKVLLPRKVMPKNLHKQQAFLGLSSLFSLRETRGSRVVYRRTEISSSVAAVWYYRESCPPERS